MSPDTELTDIRDAKAGDHSAFERAVAPYRQELHRHCYRMTGSLDDADDIVQETVFRAWRSLGTYAGRSSFRSWLYRIATNRSIGSLGGKTRQETPRTWDGHEEGIEPMWLQPYPPETDAAALVERRENIATAFVVAIQALPPKQRAALLLKDVLGFSVPETADALDTTQPAINSALQRARSSVRDQLPSRPATDAEESLRDALVDAWHRSDLKALTSLIASDGSLTMPPEPIRIVGSQNIIEFIASTAPQGRLDRLLLHATTANRQSAVGVYRLDDGPPQRFALMTLTISDSHIHHLTAFRLSPHRFDEFHLPRTVAEPGQR